MADNYEGFTSRNRSTYSFLSPETQKLLSNSGYTTKPIDYDGLAGSEFNFRSFDNGRLSTPLADSYSGTLDPLKTGERSTGQGNSNGTNQGNNNGRDGFLMSPWAANTASLGTLGLGLLGYLEDRRNNRLFREQTRENIDTVRRQKATADMYAAMDREREAQRQAMKAQEAIV